MKALKAQPLQPYEILLKTAKKCSRNGHKEGHTEAPSRKESPIMNNKPRIKVSFAFIAALRETAFPVYPGQDSSIGA